MTYPRSILVQSEFEATVWAAAFALNRSAPTARGAAGRARAEAPRAAGAERGRVVRHRRRVAARRPREKAGAVTKRPEWTEVLTILADDGREMIVERSNIVSIDRSMLYRAFVAESGLQGDGSSAAAALHALAEKLEGMAKKLRKHLK